MRQSSMSRAEAEQALGDRGAVKVTVENRRTVRKWLVACGVASSVAQGLTLSNLEAAYNDTSDSTLTGLRALAETDETDETDTAAIAVPAPAAGLGNAIEQLIAGTLAGIKPGLDESSVRTLIDERIAEIGVMRHDVTIRTDTGETIADIKGAHKTLPLLLQAMQSRQANGRHPNIMLSGPTGSGKTHAVEQCAAALGLEFYSNGAISQDYQLIGFRDAAGTYHETPLRKAFGRPAVYLFDEFDSSDNSPMLCIAAVMANSGFHFPDEFVPRHDDCIIIAAGNTWGNGATADFVGRNKIDAAIRSRFPVRIAWDYDEKLEIAMSGNPAWAARVQKARALARSHGLKVIIDPRMTQAGAGLIAAGMSEDQAAALTYLADLSSEQRTMVEG